MTPLLSVLIPLLAPLAQEPELLPQAPAGWRFERLDFPLSFAPQLEHAGFEELWFAPGMFDAESDSYFSYVLALRIEESLGVDEDYVRSFLEAYYHGLCEAVGADREPPLDLTSFQVEVERSAPGWVATIHMVDPFVTGEALRLRVELEAHAGAGRTELFGSVSPLPLDEAIWKDLRALGAAWRAARDVPALLNHLYFVPDPETYAAIRDSEFLRRAFAVSEQRTTQRRDTSYTGVYFYGRRTYFEFLEANAAGGFPPGHSGVAFGFEQAGGTKRVAAKLEAAGLTTFVGTITRGLGDEQLPWFEMMGIQQPTTASTLNLFSLEYVPAFLERWHADLAPAEGGISREAVLARYAASLDRDPEEALFRDVVAIHLALDEAELARVLEVCRLFEYEVAEDDAGWLCRGPGFDLRLTPSPEPGGVTGIELSLRKEVEREPLVFGKARLTFDGDKGVFSFE